MPSRTDYVVTHRGCFEAEDLCRACGRVLDHTGDYCGPLCWPEADEDGDRSGLTDHRGELIISVGEILRGLPDGSWVVVNRWSGETRPAFVKAANGGEQ